MGDLDAIWPSTLDEIRNFTWLVSGAVARGEQPPVRAESFQALQRAGITSVLSLRAPYEKGRDVAGRAYAEYRVEEERALCMQLGLTFHHIDLEDFSAPPPAGVAHGLTIMDAEVAAGRTLYVHCLAGVGRTGLLTGAWLIEARS